MGKVLVILGLIITGLLGLFYGVVAITHVIALASGSGRFEAVLGTLLAALVFGAIFSRLLRRLRTS